LEKDFPDTDRGHENQLVPLWKTPFNGAGNMTPTLAVTMAVVFLVLLIACANVSNLLLARSLLRRHKMAMRLALGAGRGRLVRQLVTEGLLLSLIAAVGGIAVAYWCRNALVLAFPPVAWNRDRLPRPNRLARARRERWDLHGIDSVICAGARDSRERSRSFKRAQSRSGRRSRRQQPIAIAFRACTRAGLAQFHFTRRHRITFAKPD